MTDAAQDAAAQIRSLVSLTKALSELFAQENRLIAENRAGDLKTLQADKKRLAAAYAQGIRGFAGNRALVGGADAPLLEELRSMTAAFEAQVMRQKTLLDHAADDRPTAAL